MAQSSFAKVVTRKDVARPGDFANSRSAPPLELTPTDAAAKEAAAAAAVAPDLRPEMLGTIGEEFAHNLTHALQLIQQAVSNPRAFGPGLTKTHFLIEALRRKAMSMQQIARLSKNRIRQSHETVSLPEVAQIVLNERKAENAANGIVINSRFKPVDIIIDPGLLVSLVSAALDWVSEFGTAIRLSTSMKNWPQHGQLSVIAAQGVRMQTDVDNRSAIQQSISWHLLQHTAQAMGVGMEITENTNERGLLIEFPRTVVALEGMTIMEMDAGSFGNETFGSVNSNFIAGLQVLLITPDVQFFRKVRDICKTLSLRCDHAPSVDMAERACEIGIPHLIMCEEALVGEQFETLIDDLQRHNPGFPTIMVTDGGYGFELSDWSGLNKSRVSRIQIEEQLPPALVMELSRSI